MKKRDKKEVMLVVATVIFAIVVGSGCTATNPFDKRPIRLDDPIRDATNYRYYVIDANADVPDAFFETYNEAATYQKDFAEHHEYVIVKMEGKYNVYNMSPIENDTQTVKKSE